MVDCIIFSTGRAASTSIYHYLDEMCALNLPANKEPHYWLEDALTFERIPAHFNEIYVSESCDYEQLYAKARFSVDASVGYYHYVERVVERIQDAGKTPKILMLIREPLSWARSLHVENLYQGLEKAQSLTDCLAEKRANPNLWWQLRYRDIRYREVFETLTKAFPAVMLVDYGDFRANVEGTMQAICRFLDVDVVERLSGEVHHSSRARVNAIRFPGLRLIGGHIPAAIARPAARLLMSLPTREMPCIQEDLLIEAMSKSMTSYNELQKFLAKRENERQSKDDG